MQGQERWLLKVELRHRRVHELDGSVAEALT